MTQSAIEKTAFLVNEWRAAKDEVKKFEQQLDTANKNYSEYAMLFGQHMEKTAFYDACLKELEAAKKKEEEFYSRHIGDCKMLREEGTGQSFLDRVSEWKDLVAKVVELRKNFGDADNAVIDVETKIRSKYCLVKPESENTFKLTEELLDLCCSGADARLNCAIDRVEKAKKAAIEWCNEAQIQAETSKKMLQHVLED